MEYCISKSDLVERKCLRLITCHNKRGFTIIELFIVLGVIAALSVVGIGYYNNQIEDAKILRDATNIKIINEAIGHYYQEHSLQYPRFVDFETSLALYVNQPVKEILNGLSEGNKNKIYYRVYLPYKRQSGAPKDMHDDTGIWMTKEGIVADTINANKHLVAEIKVSD